MIPITLYLIWLLIALFCAGSIAVRLLQTIVDRKYLLRPSEPNTDIAGTLLLGIVLLASSVSAISLVHPIDLKVCVGLTALLIILGTRDLWSFLKTFSLRRLGIRDWFLCAVFLVFLGSMIFDATDKTTDRDTGIYNTQTVKWNKEFGVVPGLTNLQSKLGFNSNWHMFASYVDQGPFNGRSVHIVNLLIAVIFLLACLKGFHRLLGGDRSLGTFLRCLGILVLVHDHRALIPSLSTDWTMRLLLYFAMILMVEGIEKHFAGNGRRSGEPSWEAGMIAAVCVFAVTVKLPAVPILPLLLLWWVLAKDKWRTAILMAVPAFCVAAPFTARNIIQTGYIVYPFSALDLFDFDWKVPRADVQSMEFTLKYYAINTDPETWYRTDEMGAREQIHAWFKCRGNYAASELPWLGLGTASWLSVGLIRRARQSPEFLWYCAVCCVPLVGLLLCVVRIPDPRYADGWCMVFGLLPCAWLAHVLCSGSADWISQDWKLASCLLFAGCIWWGIWQANANWVYILLPLVWLAQVLWGPTAWKARRWETGGSILLIGCSLWMVGHAHPKYRLLREGLAPIWKLYDYPEDELLEKRTEHGFTVRVAPGRNVAWNAEVPTTTLEEFNPWLEMRGKTLKDGFRVTRAGLGWGFFDPEQKFALPAGKK